jgi:hypothetical protein
MTSKLLNQKFLAAFSLLIGLMLTGAGAGSVWATDLPPAVLNYVRNKDASVEIRFDGLLKFSDGTQYLPVLPQDVLNWNKATKVISSLPENSKNPDLIQFDNNLFLIRLIPTSSGKLTFPRMDAYPIDLKEGLLPQDLVMPANLFIPAELKVLLGGLPYNPQVGGEGETGPDGRKTATGANRPFPKTLFLSNLSTNTLFAVNPDAGTIEGRIPFNCVPSSMTASSDDKNLYASCLTTDEVVVVDTLANLIKTRASVGSKPAQVLALEDLGLLVVANQFSPYLSLVQLSDFTTMPETIPLSGMGGKSMVYNPTSKHLYLADSTLGKDGKIYEIDVQNKTVKRTFKCLGGISAILLPEGSSQIWLTSRTENKVQVLSIADGSVLKTYDVGKKPVSIVNVLNKILVASANDSQIDVIHLDTETWRDHVKQSPIMLPEGSFPSGMTHTTDGKLVYVSAAGAESLFVVDVANERMFKSVALENPANSVALIGGDKTKTVLAPSRPIQPDLPLESFPDETQQSASSESEDATNNKPEEGGWGSFLKNPFGLAGDDTKKPDNQRVLQPSGATAQPTNLDKPGPDLDNTSFKENSKENKAGKKWNLFSKKPETTAKKEAPSAEVTPEPSTEVKNEPSAQPEAPQASTAN